MHILNKFLILALVLIGVNSDCFFNEYSRIKRPIFSQKFGREEFILPETEGQLKLVESGIVKAYCSSGFSHATLWGESRYSTYSMLENTKSLILQCINGNVKITINDETYHSMYDNSVLSCRGTNIGIYEAFSQTCSKNSYGIGYAVNGIPVIFAESCYDLHYMKLEYLHYVATKYSPVLSYQEKESPLNVSNISGSIESLPPIVFASIDMIKVELENQIGMESVIEYDYGDLIPTDAFLPYYKNPLEDISAMNRTIWWRNLKKGNWKKFENLLLSRSETVAYDVYTGVSDILKVPTECGTVKQLNFKIDSKRVTIPTYIWTYLKSRDNNNTDDFVVVGVNSPYFEYFPRNETIFCEDVCPLIDWMAPLEKFRKLSVFGYIFCCRTEIARNYLDGFPNKPINNPINENNKKNIPTKLGILEDNLVLENADENSNDDYGNYDVNFHVE